MSLERTEARTCSHVSASSWAASFPLRMGRVSTLNGPLARLDPVCLELPLLGCGTQEPKSSLELQGHSPSPAPSPAAAHSSATARPAPLQAFWNFYILNSKCLGVLLLLRASRASKRVPRVQDATRLLSPSGLAHHLAAVSQVLWPLSLQLNNLDTIHHQNLSGLYFAPLSRTLMMCATAEVYPSQNMYVILAKTVFACLSFSSL